MRSTAATVCTCLLLAFGLCLFVVWDPITCTDCYEYLMHMAAVRGWQFGTDVVGTYGPLGFLALPNFHPETFGRLIAANVILYLVATLSLCRYWKDVSGPGPAPVLWSALVLALPAFMSTRVYSPALYAPFVLANAFVLRHFLSKPDGFHRGEALTIAVLAACCLVKPTLCVVVVAAVAIVATDQVITWRRAPWQAAVLLAALVLAWLAAGQQLGHVASYLAGTTEITVGFNDAMSLRSPRSDALAFMFVAACAILIAVLVRATWARLRLRALGPAAALALTLFVVFRHGFIRADEPHVLPACLALAALALGMLPVLAHGRFPWRRPAVVFSVSILVLVACWRLGFGRPSVGRILFGRPAQLWALFKSGTTSLQRAAALQSEELELHGPLAGLKEPVDTSAVDTALASVNHLAMSVRPTGVMYAGYTPRLSQLNRDYIESAAGPGTILLPADVSVDGHYPTVTDSLSLLGLKSHFEQTARTDAYLVLQRRTHPLTLQLVKLEQRRVTMDETIPVPDHGSDFIWLAIDLQPTMTGRLFGMVYPPARVSITVRGDVETATFPLTIAMAREGMILAPLQGLHHGFEWLYASPQLREAEVRTLRFGVGRGQPWWYRPQAVVTFFRIALSV